jgi:hypothetical protein
MKQCTLCNEVKPLSEFNANSGYKDGYYKHCKKCHYEVYGRDAHFRRTYGITEKEYNDFVEKQNHKCSVCECEVTNSAQWGRLVVDHCHNTGKIRGFLCQPCNMALGSARDNPTTLRKLADYLENFYGNGRETEEIL